MVQNDLFTHTTTGEKPSVDLATTAIGFLQK